VCPYSECDDGGDTSAICACIDLAKYGLGEGEEWYCLHSTCSCAPVGEEDLTTTTTSSAPMAFAAVPLMAVAAVAMLN